MLDGTASVLSVHTSCSAPAINSTHMRHDVRQRSAAMGDPELTSQVGAGHLLM